MALNSIVFTEKVVWSFRGRRRGMHRSGQPERTSPRQSGNGGAGSGYPLPVAEQRLRSDGDHL